MELMLNMNNNLTGQIKDLLYDAYGVCSYLAAWEAEDLQDMLNDELLQFSLQAKPENNDFIEAALPLMLYKDGESPQNHLEKIRCQLRAALKKPEFNPAAVTGSEFEWANQRMLAQNPSLSYFPLENLLSLFELAAEDNEQALISLKPLQKRLSAIEPENRKEKEKPKPDKKSAGPVPDFSEDHESLNPASASSPEEALSKSSRKEMQEKLDGILAELDSMTGLSEVKKQVHDLADYLQIQKIRQDAGLKNPSLSRHMIFYGNPGTGKTTVARLLGKIYRDLGLLKKGQLIETDRSGLVAGYIGQTAQKTQEVIKKALGGILFIDEAYSLIRDSSNDFGKEAVETLLKEMEDHRDDLVVIAAGYPEQMDTFLNSNPGLSSRFGTRIRFDNYSAGELRQIAADMAESMDYQIDEKALDLLEDQVSRLLEQSDSSFGNARTIRNLLEKAMMKQARRLISQEKIEPEDLSRLLPEDFSGEQSGLI